MKHMLIHCVEESTELSPGEQAVTVTASLASWAE